MAEQILWTNHRQGGPRFTTYALQFGSDHEKEDNLLFSFLYDVSLLKFRGNLEKNETWKKFSVVDGSIGSLLAC